jgi:hypothetical protein
MISMKRRTVAANAALVLSSILFSSTAALAAPAYEVINGDDDGAGSLRDALGSGATVIVIDDSVSAIDIDNTLIYDDEAALKIVGSGQTVLGGDFTLLAITEGADLTISDLDFEGPGGYDVENQGGGKGIFVDVPDDREGVVSLNLTNVSVSHVGKHGVHVSDCDLAVCGAGGGGGGDGSPASIYARLANVTIDGVGNGGFDADGMRIDDRGDGDILFIAVDSVFVNVGADGVELDEGNDGDVIVEVRNSVFEFNGGYCFPVDPDDPPYADPTCVEDDDGELVLDLDDGFDIDEAGNGSLLGSIRNIWISNNLDEGLDFDEEGDDGINIELVGIEAWGNGDEGVKLSEEDGGDVTARLRSLTVAGNGDDGIQIEQDHAGDINVTVNGTITMDNAKNGLKVVQDGPGGGSLKVRGSDISDGIDSDVPEI